MHTALAGPWLIGYITIRYFYQIAILSISMEFIIIPMFLEAFLYITSPVNFV